MGQGLIIVKQSNDQDAFESIMWPNGRALTVSLSQLQDPNLCDFLETLPQQVFAPYAAAHEKLTQNPNTQYVQSIN